MLRLASAARTRAFARPAALRPHLALPAAPTRRTAHTTAVAMGARGTKPAVATSAIAAKEAPVGEWVSPITSDLIVSKTVRVGSAAFGPDGALLWLEGRPEEAGRSVLVLRFVLPWLRYCGLPPVRLPGGWASTAASLVNHQLQRHALCLAAPHPPLPSGLMHAMTQ